MFSQLVKFSTKNVMLEIPEIDEIVQFTNCTC